MPIIKFQGWVKCPVVAEVEVNPNEVEDFISGLIESDLAYALAKPVRPFSEAAHTKVLWNDNKPITVDGQPYDP